MKKQEGRNEIIGFLPQSGILMEQIIAVTIFGAIGSVARFILSRTIQQWLGMAFPYGVLAVNIIGCFLIGILATWLIERFNVGAVWRAAILIGFLGGFTTFSSFTIDTITMLEGGDYFKALSYVFLTVIVCLAVTWFGVILGRSIL